MGQKLEDALKITRRAALFGGAGLGLAACATPPRGPAVPIARTRDARVLGLPNERFFFPWDGDAFRTEVLAAQARARQIYGVPRRGQERTIELLAISGGGENGAFGAGLLNGWTEAGNRPIFSLVTGVSTGALTAPFAFLGPRYDAALKSVYTDLTPKDVLEQRYLLSAALFEDALADSAPLFRLISRYLTEEMLADIARAHERGRLLLIGTSDIDAQLPVAWNIGAIAASGHPEALNLFRRILLASASIPGAFPPVMIDVEAEGRAFQEMHVDGGAAMQVFLYPARLRLRALAGPAGQQRETTAWVIRNGRVDVAITDPPGGIFSIARRSAQTLLHFSSINDLDRIYLSTYRDRIGFRLQSIGPDFDTPRPRFFDNAYMRALFAYGEARGRDVTSWVTAPPPVGLISPPPPGP